MRPDRKDSDCRIVTGTGDGREIRTRFPEAHSAEGPTAKSKIGETVHVRKEFSILADREIIGGGKHKNDCDAWLPCCRGWLRDRNGWRRAYRR
jgi:hypothetical protein